MTASFFAVPGDHLHDPATHAHTVTHHTDRSKWVMPWSKQHHFWLE